MTDHIALTLDHAAVDLRIPGGMRWTPQPNTDAITKETDDE